MASRQLRGWVLESYVTRTRDKKAALTFMKKALKRHGRAEAIVTDGLRSDPEDMPIFIACRDPEVYRNPHVADLERKENMLALANGPHLCLGMQTARQEIRIALESFLNRFEDFRIPDGVQHTCHTGSTFNVDSLPIAWTRKS